MCLKLSDKDYLGNINRCAKFQLITVDGSCGIAFWRYLAYQRTSKPHPLTQDPQCQLKFLLISVDNWSIYLNVQKYWVALWNSFLNKLIFSENRLKSVCFRCFDQEPAAPAIFIAYSDRGTSNTWDCEKISHGRVGLGVLSANWSTRSALSDKSPDLIWCAWISQIRTDYII